MQVSKIKDLLADYKMLLQQGRVPLDLHLWEAQKVFQDNWDVDAPDFADMYSRAINSKETQRYWKDRQYQPKQMMELFLKMDTPWVKSMFDDLLNEERGIEARVGRFLFLMDETLNQYRSKHPLSIDTNHHHGDYRMISLYLSFRYPEKYAYYVHEDFTHFLKVVNSPKIPLVPDFVRFCKVAKIIYTFMEKDQELITTFQHNLLPSIHYTGENRMIVFDFLRSRTFL